MLAQPFTATRSATRASNWSQIPGNYFTAMRAAGRDGYYWVMGRIDDVINVSGMIEHHGSRVRLVAHSKVAEAA